MKQALFALILGLGIGLTGCAAGEEDEVLPTPAPEEQRDPPKQALNAQLQDPQLQLISHVEANDAFNRVPAKQLPVPVPVPTPE